MSKLEEALHFQIKGAGLPEPVREYRFHDTRRWRLDFAYPEHMLALEVEGGTWVNGRHNRALGLEADCEKYNTATLMGWKVLRVTGNMVNDGRALMLLEEALG